MAALGMSESQNQVKPAAPNHLIRV